MNQELAVKTLNKLESSLFRELFLKNTEKAKRILRKQQSILKFEKSANWLLENLENLNIPKKTVEKLLSKGFEKVIDIVYLTPLRVEDYSLKDPKNLKDGEYAAIEGILLSKNRGNRVLSLIVNSNGTHIRCNWFNITPYIRKLINSLKLGDEIVCLGKITIDGFVKQLNHPTIKRKEEFEESKRVVYPSIGTLKNATIQKVINETLKIAPKKPFEWLPYTSLVRNNLPFFSDFLEKLHSGDLEKAEKRLKYEEIFLLLLALRLQEENFKRQKSPIIEIDEDFIETVEAKLPFELTHDQKKALNEIFSDLKKRKPMLRLLQGDVGCGKTIVSLIASLAVSLKGYQTAIMTPTQPLAIQFFSQANSLFSIFNLKVELLLSSTKNKNKIYKALEQGEIDCIVGTHSLLQENVKFKNLGFIVIDEQHRFGVEQRKTLTEKGVFPHVLIMSATPIPRTLSMVLYSKSELSTIREKPKNRGEVKTLHFYKRDSEKAYRIAIEEIKKGHQVYVIAPLIDESEFFEDVEAAKKLYEQLKNSYFKDYKIELLYGKLKPEEKERIIKDFREGRIDCLVSTTVIEVGIDSPKATVIVVENAERFGLAQLHQLRGRVGRSSLKSYAIFITDENLGENAKKRIEALLKTNDGFEIAEMDFKLRGAGEILGTKQHGRELNHINLIEDKKIIDRAKSDVEMLIEKGYPINEGLKKIMKYRWEKKLGYIKVG